jgi:hypothetical protein
MKGWMGGEFVLVTFFSIIIQPARARSLYIHIRQVYILQVLLIQNPYLRQQSAQTTSNKTKQSPPVFSSFLSTYQGEEIDYIGV